MRPWVIWLIKHRLGWVVKTVVVLTIPLQFLAYYPDVMDNVRYTLRNIKNKAREL